MSSPEPAPVEPTPALAIDNLSFAYDGRIVLEEVSLRLPRLDFASIVGPNGSGKTTLVKLILGLLRPTSGSLQVLGETPVKARPRIGYLPQYSNPDPSFPITVSDVVKMGRLNASRRFGPYSRADHEAARAALDEVGLAHFGERLYATLSGGERQRVLVARALASGPELLLLDEPDAGLDQRFEHELHDLLCTLNRHLTVLLVSHDLGFVSSFVKTVICVNREVKVHPTSEIDGRIISEIYGGDVRMVRHDHNLRESDDRANQGCC
jgi:zinc transport system ATP-binding protein